MFLLLTIGIPTVCYLGAAIWLAVVSRNIFDALMFLGYALANVGIMLRLAQ